MLPFLLLYVTVLLRRKWQFVCYSTAERFTDILIDRSTLKFYHLSMGREKKLTKCERQVVFKTCTAVFSLILRILIAEHCTMMIWTYGRLLWSSEPKTGGYFASAKAEYFVELVQKPAWRANTSFTVFYLFIVIVISIQVCMKRWCACAYTRKCMLSDWLFVIQDQVQAFINLFHCDENKKVEKCAKNRYAFFKLLA